MGYQNETNQTNNRFRNDMSLLNAKQGFDAGQNDKQNQTSRINTLVNSGVPYQDAYNQVMGTGGGMSIDRQTAISQYGSTPAVRNFNPGNITDT